MSLVFDPVANLQRGLERFTEGERRNVVMEARKRFRIAETFEAHNRAEAIEDFLLRAGFNHWDAVDEAQRIKDKRPCLTFNLIPELIENIVGEVRKMRPGVSVAAVDLNAGKVRNIDGTSDFALAQVYESAVRNIERLSDAESAYDWGFECGLTGGFGYWRWVPQLIADDLFDMDIRILKVWNPFSVYLDPQALLRGPEHANWGMIVEHIPREEARDRWPNASFSFDVGLGQGQDAWFMTDAVQIAEYYKRVRVKKNLTLLSSGRVVEAEKYIQVAEQLADEQGIVPIRTEERELPIVQKFLISGGDVLEQPKVFPGRNIPFAPVYGRVTINKGKPIVEGLIRHTHDAQRAYNIWETSKAEMVALQPLAPFQGPADAFEGFEAEWQASHLVKNYLRWNPTAKEGPTRQPPPQISTGFVELSEAARENVFMTSIGRSRQELETQTNQSGRALLARQAEGDSSSFTFVDNLNKAIRYTGASLVDMIPRVYSSERVLRLRFRDDTEEFVRVNVPVPRFRNGRIQMEVMNDLSAGRFDVTTEAGQNFKTQRMLAVEMMSEILRSIGPADVQALRILLPHFIRNVDMPGADEISRQFEKLVPPELQDSGEGGDQQQISPEQVQQLLQAARQEGAVEALQQAGVSQEQFKLLTERLEAIGDFIEAQAKMTKAQADQTAADAELIEAQTGNVDG